MSEVVEPPESGIPERQTLHRVFVSEYVCGGAWPEPTIQGSLAREGRAMLLAVIADLLRVLDCEVVTTWDARLDAFPLGPVERLRVVRVESPAEEDAVFTACCGEAGSSIVIAPEFHGILSARVALAESAGTLIGCSREATNLCSDKLALSSRARELGIATIKTTMLNVHEPSAAFAFPIVVKPRDGAGSTDTRIVNSEPELRSFADELLRSGIGSEMIQQPFVRGLACSTAALIDPVSRQINVLPPAEQVLSDDDCLSYLGIDLPGRVTPSQREAVEQFVRRCCTAWPELSGYVGFDLLLPLSDDEQSSVILVEINPRLTTSYLAWRQLTDDNLASRLLPDSVSKFVRSRPIHWHADNISFRLASEMFSD